MCAHGVWSRHKTRESTRGADAAQPPLRDPRSSAILLAGTTLFLALLIAGSVALLYRIGDVPLPGTLSAVSGMGPAGAKRD